MLSRALVTDALEDGAETPRWLEEQFPDLDEKYGPKIRTREYHGEHARTYVGEMSGGEPHGAGTTTWKSGDRYEGAFENGHRHGQGVYDYPDGNRYEGAWQEGVLSGQGVMTYADGGRYEGGWRKSKRHGQGACAYPPTAAAITRKRGGRAAKGQGNTAIAHDGKPGKSNYRSSTGRESPRARSPKACGRGRVEAAAGRSSRPAVSERPGRSELRFMQTG